MTKISRSESNNKSVRTFDGSGKVGPSPTNSCGDLNMLTLFSVAIILRSPSHGLSCYGDGDTSASEPRLFNFSPTN